MKQAGKVLKKESFEITVNFHNGTSEKHTNVQAYRPIPVMANDQQAVPGQCLLLVILWTGETYIYPLNNEFKNYAARKVN